MGIALSHTLYAQYHLTPINVLLAFLMIIYGVWVLTVLLLYPACRWFAGVKERRRDLWWLGYL